MKHCPSCNHPKPYVEFTKNRQNADGYATYCKTHHREKLRQWRKENPQKVLKMQAKWRKNRQDKAKAALALQTARALAVNQSFSPDGTSEK